jgi:hypothetical protein
MAQFWRSQCRPCRCPVIAGRQVTRSRNSRIRAGSHGAAGEFCTLEPAAPRPVCRWRVAAQRLRRTTVMDTPRAQAPGESVAPLRSGDVHAPAHQASSPIRKQLRILLAVSPCRGCGTLTPRRGSHHLRAGADETFKFLVGGTYSHEASTTQEEEKGMGHRPKARISGPLLAPISTPLPSTPFGPGGAGYLVNTTDPIRGPIRRTGGTVERNSGSWGRSASTNPQRPTRPLLRGDRQP